MSEIQHRLAQTPTPKSQRLAPLIVSEFGKPPDLTKPSGVDKGLAGIGLVLVLAELVYMWPFWPYETDASGRSPSVFPIWIVPYLFAPYYILGPVFHVFTLNVRL